MKRLAALLAVSGLALNAAPVAAWGPTGHRIVAQIAQDNLSGQTRAHVEEILGREGLAEAATWPDEQKSNPAEFWRDEASPWHYITLKAEQKAKDLVHPLQGDAVTALEKFTQELRDPDTSPEERALALRFIVHLVGDLHQPLHAGKEGDRGGNDAMVQWFDDPVQRNLHWVWDEGMIDKQQISFTENADRLENRMTPQQVIQWWDPKPNDWINESIALRNRIYPMPSAEYGNGTVEAPFKLEYHYVYDWKPSMELRLEQAGIRLAAYLDWVFSGD